MGQRVVRWPSAVALTPHLRQGQHLPGGGGVAEAKELPKSPVVRSSETVETTGAVVGAGGGVVPNPNAGVVVVVAAPHAAGGAAAVAPREGTGGAANVVFER